MASMSGSYAKAWTHGHMDVWRLDTQRFLEEVVAADHPAEDVAWPNAGLGGRRLVHIHCLENAKIDLRSVPEG